jgi:hypothetical protein
VAFRHAVSAYLGLEPPYPKIIWFTPEDAYVAKAEWRLVVDKYPNAHWGIDDNPFLAPSDCFRFPQESGDEIFCGFTPADNRNTIGIAVSPERCCYVDAIAEECVHVAQDVKKPGWRMNNIVAAEDEARQRVIEIRAALPQFFDEQSP